MKMNCHICGEEREVAGYICQPCLDVEIEKELKENGMRLLTPKEAIIAMLDGVALFTRNGDQIIWKKSEYGFVYLYDNKPLTYFSGLYMKVG